MRSDRSSLPVIVALVVAACGGDSVTGPGDTPVASVSVAPTERAAFPGDTFTLVATPHDMHGKTLSGRTVSWQSLNPSAATVSVAGLVQAKSEGTAVIVATVEGKSGSAQVRVEEQGGSVGPVAAVDVWPSSADIEEGKGFQLQATPRDAAGHEVPGRPIQWISEDPGIAYVTPGGELWALRPGRVMITASTEGKSGSAIVSIWANFDFDLLYDGWSGVPGVGPELFVHDVGQVNGAPLSIAVPGYGGTGDPTPSPDGGRIAFVRYSSYGDTDIFVANRDGTGLIQLTTDRAFDDQPAWSPDGQQIAFRRWPQAAGPDIWVMDAGDGGNAVNLTGQGNLSQNSPAWSPPRPGGGYRIAYAQAENGEAHIWSMKADGTDRRQITGGPFYDDQPAWSPDGSTIAFQRNGVAVFGDIYLADAVGGNERWLVSLPFGQFAPAWSPDGKLIAFASKHEGGGIYQIYTVRLDGRPVARRTSDSYHKGNPVWLVRR